MAEQTDDSPQRGVDAYADRVPVFVRQGDGGFALVRTSDGTIVQDGFDRVRGALDAALEASFGGALKTPNLRSDGEPDGVWRWLDATAVEDAPTGGTRVDEDAIWSMAAALNARASAVPIDGGGSPSSIYAPSEPHGMVRDPATLANGYMHVGVPVEMADRDAAGETSGQRLHLFTRAELLPEIAREVDRGRLAYTSVHFRWADGAEPAKDGHVDGAYLASLALLNDPAVTTLTPGSERQAVRGHARLRIDPPTASELENPMKTETARKTLAIGLALSLRAAADPGLSQLIATRSAAPKGGDKRGPALETLRALAATLGMSVEDALSGDDYRPKLVDSVCQLVEAGKLETILEAGTAAPDAAANAARAVEGLEGPAAEAMLARFLKLAHTVTGKPDATPEELATELESSEDRLKTSLADATPPDGGLPADNQQQQQAAPPNDAPPNDAPREAALNAADANELALLRADKRLREECAKRGVDLAPEKAQRWAGIAVRNGWDVVAELLEQEQAKPPSGDSVMGKPRPGARTAAAEPAPTTAPAGERIRAATAACREEALQALRAEGNAKPTQPVLYARQQKIAAARWPDLPWGKSSAKGNGAKSATVTAG